MRCLILMSQGFCGACYSARRGRSAGHRKLPRLTERDLTPLEEEEMAMKRSEPEGTQPTRPTARDEVLYGWLPTVHEWLTETQWDDGKPRRTTTLMVVVENGRWKCWVHDRDSKRSAWVSADAWEALWEILERGLQAEDLEWRKDTR